MKTISAIGDQCALLNISNLKRENSPVDKLPDNNLSEYLFARNSSLFNNFSRGRLLH